MASKGDFAQLPPWPLLHLAACDASKGSEKDALALIRTAAVSVAQGGRDSNSPRKVFEGSDWQLRSQLRWTAAPTEMITTLYI